MAITRNIGMICLSIYLILIGATALFGVAVPGTVMSVLALVAGILLLLGI